ncbi:hypothetical protein PV646_28700 [Streptomyces sp. ID05-26A]|nr:hypothetical protein [Streptomyces sp. ID05-26A]
MKRLRQFVRDHVTVHGNCRVNGPWIGIGPVWNGGTEARVIGVDIAIGKHGFAIHRRPR